MAIPVVAACRPRPVPLVRNATPSSILHLRHFWSKEFRRYGSSVAATGELRKTPLYDFHLARKAKMVPFADHHMPVLYASQGLSESHHFTRKHASLFDVSHMVQHRFRGPAAAAFLEVVCPSAIAAMPPLQSKLTTFLWPETGGIVDDSVVTRLGDEDFYVVTNGACRDKDLDYFEQQLGEFRRRQQKKTHQHTPRNDGDGDGDRVTRESYQGGLLALQGPEAVDIVQEMLEDPSAANLKGLTFGNVVQTRLRLAGGSLSAPLILSRGGYTGEDGFEMALAPGQTLVQDTTALAEALLLVGGEGRVRVAGLGARDSLRLEAGMCLYGHDLDDSTTPVEAGLSWIIPPERRARGGFHGSDVILKQLTPRSKGGSGVDRRRVGLLLDQGGGAPAREGAEVRAPRGGETVGRVTSGMPSPTLGANIAMGYVRDGFHKVGTEVEVVVRGKAKRAVVAKMPFVPTRYWRGEGVGMANA